MGPAQGLQRVRTVDLRRPPDELTIEKVKRPLKACYPDGFALDGVHGGPLHTLVDQLLGAVEFGGRKPANMHRPICEFVVRVLAPKTNEWQCDLTHHFAAVTAIYGVFWLEWADEAAARQSFINQLHDHQCKSCLLDSLERIFRFGIQPAPNALLWS